MEGERAKGEKERIILNISRGECENEREKGEVNMERGK